MPEPPKTFYTTAGVTCQAWSDRRDGPSTIWANGAGAIAWDYNYPSKRAHFLRWKTQNHPEFTGEMIYAFNEERHSFPL